MNVGASTLKIKLTETEAGVLRIGEICVSYNSVVTAFKQGSAPEEIVYDFDSLTLSEVYAPISYYLQNQKEAEAYLFERSNQNEQLRETVEARFNHTGLSVSGF